jgi:hypothetical protein
MSALDTLTQKLEEFIKKYYINELLKGAIYAVGLTVLFFLGVLILQYLGGFHSTGRAILFYSFISAALFILINNILMPLSRMMNLTKRMSYEDAAKIVGKSFEDINDKVLNTLQLCKSNALINKNQLDLVTASIQQRISQLKPIPFTNAINLSDNKKHLRFLAVPVFLFLGVFVYNKEIITSGTDSLYNYDKEIQQVNPFEFEVANDKLEVLQQDDFELIITVKEKEFVPEVAYINIDGKSHKLKKINKKQFSYTFRNVQKNQSFYISSQEVKSKEFELKTIPKPTLLSFDIIVDYPAYTGLKDETVKNLGDMVIPEGTKLQWVFNTKNTKSLHLRISDSLHTLPAKGLNIFQKEHQFFESVNYTISTENEFTIGKDSITYFITVTKDAHPTIDAEETADTLNAKLLYFNGKVADDFGFTRLNFQYKITSAEGKEKETSQKGLAVNKSFNRDQFFHFFDLSQLPLEPGDKVEYFFQVWDNDGVNGAKSARTSSKIYKAPTLQELAANADKSNEMIKDDLQKSLDEAERLKKELEAIKKSLYDKEKPDWQDKNKIEQFLQNQNALQQNVEKLKQENIKSQQDKNQFNQMSQEILDKQEMLNKLFEELMNDEMKALYKELEKMMEQMNKNQLLNQMEKIEMSQEQVAKELDRALEQFKQLQMDEKLQSISDQLKDLSERQEKLAEDTKNKEKSNFDLNKEQEQLKEDFNKVRDELDQLNELNEELENKRNLEQTEEMEQQISEEMKKSSEELGNDKNKKASESQKSAAEKMEELAQKMEEQKTKEQQEQAQEDLDALRQLIENLINFSIEQEDVMTQFRSTSTNDPKYVKLGQRQRKLKDDAQMLEDSLFALSKRVMQLGPFINKEVAEMNQNIGKSMKFITERQTPMVMSNQQYVMTSVNNLALLFDEAMKQMQEQMKNSPPGSGSCSKPGGTGKPSPGKMSMEQMQQQLKDQLKKMQEAMEKGEKPGGKEDGEKGDGGKKPGDGKTPGQGGMNPGEGGMGNMPGMSQQLAEMAAQQAALRQKIQELSQELNKDGTGAGNGLKEIVKEMEKVEEDIVNMRISNQTINRQKDIMTRLLEHEKAQREQEYDEKRKANEAKEYEISNPSKFLEYKLKKEKELELLKTIPPSLKPYYKNKVNEYFEQLNN